MAWCQEVATTKVKRFQAESYWGKPLPGFGDSSAKLLVVGLAPGAHGANRTGRMFTGDRSGDWLFRALRRAGFCNTAISRDRKDSLELYDCYIGAVARCAPPENRLLAAEIKNCRSYLEREIELLTELKVIVPLGQVAFNETLSILVKRSADARIKRPRFGHGVEFKLDDLPAIIASFHPSQQNTFTGRLTEEMLERVFKRAAELVGRNS